ncbi:hypothetical protein NEUTE1DRAFT_108096 [Neurospora tetrasperma FGSC 2508]|uniref:Uncharacterized protein n=1 Tax=Neurospora tetrasperma (strain FGSC 2508 / ATCC MYA-4615 / P0657) TaxID=510951 RepID=F8MEM3_NEUT8|nr:uncharacterized protein NEUTE1DRAFT_108096 [Neurospora tetrasperma FGSC 2508]EGO61652.1 hypothetical protein NEUTE1DRAFT_108096 [Neurospora tetrasperma FGSC 2508]
MASSLRSKHKVSTISGQNKRACVVGVSLDGVQKPDDEEKGEEGEKKRKRTFQPQTAVRINPRSSGTCMGLLTIADEDYVNDSPLIAELRPFTFEGKLLTDDISDIYKMEDDDIDIRIKVKVGLLRILRYEKKEAKKDEKVIPFLVIIVCSCFNV